MKTPSKISALVLAGLLSATALGTVTSVYAADAAKPAATVTATDSTEIVEGKMATAEKDAVAKATQSNKDEKAIIATMDEAYAGLREVHAARLAIFNGTPDVAQAIVEKASIAFNAALLNMPEYAVKTQKVAVNGDEYIPFDSSISLSEGFVPTAEKQTTLQAANEHLAKGEHTQAITVLKEASIDVTVSAAFIPANASVGHIKDAVKLISEKKYYEANLALKAIEDSVLTESYSVDAVPAQGVAG